MSFELALAEIKLLKRMRRDSWASYAYVVFESGAVGTDNTEDYILVKKSDGIYSWGAASEDLLANDWSELV